jgi:hypothetical protein
MTGADPSWVLQDLLRQVFDLFQTEFVTLVDVSPTRRASSSSAAARARRRPRATSVGLGVPDQKSAMTSGSIPFGVKRAPVSCRPYRVTTRVMSWLPSTQVEGASTSAVAARVRSMTFRWEDAVHSHSRASKLKVVCSSSGRMYLASSLAGVT